MLSLQEAQ